MENFLLRVLRMTLKEVFGSGLTKTILLLALFNNFNTSFAQKYVWAKSIGGSANDIGSKTIVVDNSGNLYTAGNFQGTVDFDPGTGVAFLNSAGGSDIFIAKYDIDGNYVWAKRIGGSLDDYVNEIVIGSSGDLIITGSFQGTVIDFDPGTGAAYLNSAGGSDIFYAKYTTSGNYVFAQSLGGSSNDAGKSVKESGGYYYITGEFMNSVDFDPGVSTSWLIANGSVPVVFLGAYTSTGSYVSAIKIDGSGTSKVSKLELDKNGYLFITGNFSGAPDFDPGFGTDQDVTLYSKGVNDVFLAKYNMYGNLSWAKGIGGIGNDVATDIVLDAYNNPIITGSFTSTADFNNYGYYITSNGDSDIFIGKYNGSDGSLSSAVGFGGSGPDIGTSIDIDNLGNIILGGTYIGANVDFDPGNITNTLSSKSNSNDIFFGKYNNYLNFISAISLGGITNNDMLNDLKFYNSKIYLAGYFTGTNVDFNPGSATANLSAATTDMFYLKYSSCYPPSIDSLNYTSVDTNSLAFKANIISLNGDTAYNRGFICWEYDESDRTIDDPLVMKFIQNGSYVNGQFTGSFSGLLPGTTYSVRAYATNSAGTGYSYVSNFSTLRAEPTGHSSYFTGYYSANGEGYYPMTSFEFDPANNIGATGYIILERLGASPTSLPSDGVRYYEDDSLGNAKVVSIVDYYQSNYYNNYAYKFNYDKCGKYYYKLIPYNWDGNNASSTNYRTKATIPSDTVDVYLRPELTSNTPLLVTTSSFKPSANLDDGCMTVTERGFVYTTNPYQWYPDINYDDYVYQSGSFSSGKFSDSISGLYSATQYQYAPYAINGAAINYGEVQTVWTLTSEPTKHASYFTATASLATNSIHVNFPSSLSQSCQGYIILVRTDYVPTGLPTDGKWYNEGDIIGDTRIARVITNNTQTSDSFTNILTGHVYYFKLIPYNYYYYSYETVNYRTLPTIPSASAAMPTTPTLSTNSSILNISSSGASVKGEITNTGAVNATKRGICYKDSTSMPTISDSIRFESGSFGTGIYPINLTNLKAETNYTYRAYATNPAGTGYSSNTNSFWTYSVEPSTFPSTFTAITNSSTQIQLNFSAAKTITNCAGYVIVMKQDSVPVSTPTDGTAQSVGYSNGVEVVCAIVTNTNTTSTIIGNLNPGNKYYFTIYPFNWNGVNTATYNYKTKTIVPNTFAYTIVPATLTTSQSVTVISSSAADVTGTINYLGSDTSVSTRGICYKIFGTGDPTTANSTNNESGNYSLGNFTRSLIGLNAETQYKARAYAINRGGTGYGNTIDFWTFSTLPSSHAVSFNATTTSTSQIDLTFSAASTITNADGYLILMKQGSAPSSLPKSGLTYTSGNIIGDATVVAYINSTSTTSASITGLNSGNAYYFKLIPFNWDGTNTQTCNYRTLATIPSANASTIVPPTVITNSVISNIGSSVADVAGEITVLNGVNATTRGICYKVYAAGNPTTTDSTRFETGNYGLTTFSRTLTGLSVETRYKARAYAINSGGTGYGSISYDFYTLSTEPSSHASGFTATTVSTTQIDLSFSAASTITNADGYLIIMKQGSAPSGTPTDGNAYYPGSTFGDATVSALINSTSVTTASIYGLSAGNNYYFKLIPYNWDLTNSQTYNYRILATIPSANATTIVSPTVTTSPVISNISSTTADVAGEITVLNGANATTRGICYKVYATGNPTTSDSTRFENGNYGLSTFSRTLTGLSAETRYKARAYAINSGGTGYGSVSYDFYTLSTEPTSHASGFTATTISTTQIDLSFSAASTISSADGYLIIMKQGSAPSGSPTDGTAYSTGSSFGDATVVALINSTSVTTANIYSLNSGNIYYFKLIPFNWDQTNSQTYNYRTLATIPTANASTIIPPTVITSSVIANISSTTTDVAGEITALNGANATTRGICYKIYAAGNPSTTDSTRFETGNFGLTTFSRTLTGLSAQTRYKARAYAINPGGTGYGSISYDFYTLSTEPSAHAASFTATTVSTTQIDLGFSAASTISNADGYLIIMKQGAAPSGTPTDGLPYSTGSTFGDATVMALINSTSVTTANISGLNPGNAYYFKLIPFNWDQTNSQTYNYRILTTIPTANATTILVPTVTTSSVIANISSTGADVAGDITATNGANATTRGICYKIYAAGNPATTDSIRIETGNYTAGTFSRTLSGLVAETRYKARAYAINPAGTGYGSVSYDFYTLSTEPTSHAASFTATAISTTQIDLGFSAASTITNADGYLIIMKQGAAPSGTPTDGLAYTTGSSLGDATVVALINGTSVTTASIYGLNSGNVYYFKLIPFNWDQLNSQTYNYRILTTIPTANASTIIAPSVTTSSIIANISSTGADVSGDITATNGANATTRGICYIIYATGNPITTDSTRIETGNFSTGTFSRTLTGLAPQTRYKARAYAINSAGTGYGSISYDFYTFSTEPLAHAASFTASTVSTTQIDLSFSAASTITNADGYLVIMKQGAAPSGTPTDGLPYSTGSTFGDATVMALINSTSTTTASITGLNSGNAYYFKLIPFNWDQINSQTNNYRILATIPTANATTIVPPTVTTSSVIANISSTAADVSGDITATNGANTTTRGICYKIYATGNPTTSDSIRIETGNFSTGTFSRTLTGLTAETRYKARAYAINSAGTGYGSISYDFYTFSTEPAAHAAKFTATTTSTTQIDLIFSAASTISNADGYLIIMKQGSAPTGTPTDGQTYSIGSSFGDATVAAYISNTADTIASIGGLNTGNTYYFKLIPYNWDKTNSQTYNYRTQATIPTANAATIVPPTITTSSLIANISSNGADVSGNITALNGANVTTRGICYKIYTGGNPTISDSLRFETGNYGLGTYSRSLTNLSAETRYKVRAYAINSSGTGYGSIIYDFYTFSTEPSAHAAKFAATTISTSQIDLTFSAASTVSNADGYLIIMKQGSAPSGTPTDGIAYSIGSSFGDAIVAAYVSSTSDTLVSIGGLNTGNSYYFKLIPYNWDQTNSQTYNYRIQATIPTANAATIIPPTVTTSSVIANIDVSGADVSGNITALNGANVTTRGICYKIYATGNPTTADSIRFESGNYGVGSFSRSLTNLSAETRYKARAYAINSGGTGYGSVSYDFYTFSTEPAAHAAKFTASTISTSQIDLAFSAASTITNADGYLIIMKQGSAPTGTPTDGLAYSTGGTFGDATVVAYISNTTDSVASIVGLNTGNSYYFKLIPYNWDQTNSQTYNYRIQATIPTANAATIVPPTVSTSSVIANIGTTGADVSGNIVSLNGANATKRGVCYKVYVSGDPTTSDSINSESATFGLGSFSRTLSGLFPETRYKVRAFAINSGGTGYGSISYDFFTFSTEPAAHAAKFTATTISTSQIDLDFSAASTITNADGYLIIMKQGSAPTGTPTNGLVYNTGNSFGDATVVAYISNTTDTIASIGGLNTGNTYYFKLIPYNWDQTNSQTYNYRIQATIPTAYAATIIPPYVTTSSVIDSISSTRAYLTGSITAINGANATKRGICYNVYTTADPTTADSTNSQTGNFGLGSFSRMLSGLIPETRYKARAYAINSGGTGYGNVSYDFFTFSIEPDTHAISFTATTASTSQIDLDFSAAHTINNADGYIIIQKQDAIPTGLPIDGHSYSIGSSIGNGTLAAFITDTSLTETSITSVTSGNKYYFSLIPFSWDGMNTQTINYLTTGTIPIASASTITVPLVTTTQISNISTSSADISGNITNIGGKKPSVRGVCYKIYSTGDPLITDSTNQDSGTFVTGVYTQNLISLLPETRYNARAFATNYAGTGYGNTLEFFTLSSEPTTHANQFTAVSYTSSQIILNFQQADDIPNADGYIIIQSQGAVPNGLPVDGTAYTTGNARGNGIVAAIINDVYQTSITLTNLNSGTKYYYLLIPFNWNGNNPETYNYFTTATIPLTFATTMLPCSINSSLRVYGPSIVCYGDSVKLEVDLDTSLTYHWTKNNIFIPGADSNVYFPSTTGEYKVFIDNGTCSVVSANFSLSNYPIDPPIIVSTGSITPCSSDSMLLSTSEYSTYLWSNNDTLRSTWVRVSGNYYVTVTDKYGCKIKSYGFTVNAAAMEPPTICLVTVDSASGKNLIVWERPVTSLIDSYYIYKESTQAGIYKVIGRLGYNDLSVFVDSNSNPAVKADRYRITIIDTCGIESAPSPVHKTMHLSINKGINGENNLIWDYYEGFTFSTYKILRGSSPGNLRPIALIQNNLTSYSDINPPKGLLFYQVVVVKPDPCSPAILRAQTSSGPYSQSVSNLKDYSAVGTDYLSAYPDELTIGKEKNSTKTITLYTNLNSWSAYSSEPWLEIISDLANKAIIVNSNSENTDPSSRAAMVIIKSTAQDSIIITVYQKGSVGISDQYAQNNNLNVYPNPYVNSTNIEYELHKTTNVRIAVYDVYGKPVSQLISEKQRSGKHNIRFSAVELGLAEGIYYLLFEADGKRSVKKLIEMH